VFTIATVFAVNPVTKRPCRTCSSSWCAPTPQPTARQHDDHHARRSSLRRVQTVAAAADNTAITLMGTAAGYRQKPGVTRTPSRW